MTTFQYRTLVLVSLALCWASAFLDQLVPRLLPEALKQAEIAAYAGQAPNWMMFVLVLAIASVLGMLAASYGLLRFRPWAPKFAVLATGLLIVTSATVEAVAISGIAFSVHALSWLCWGSAVLLSFTHPVKAWFVAEKRPEAIAA
jgi:hypothetical protein